jgi:hypothetical protein
VPECRACSYGGTYDMSANLALPLVSVNLLPHLLALRTGLQCARDGWKRYGEVGRRRIRQQALMAQALQLKQAIGY